MHNRAQSVINNIRHYLDYYNTPEMQNLGANIYMLNFLQEKLKIKIAKDLPAAIRSNVELLKSSNPNQMVVKGIKTGVILDYIKILGMRKDNKSEEMITLNPYQRMRLNCAIQKLSTSKPAFFAAYALYFETGLPSGRKDIKTQLAKEEYRMEEDFPNWPINTFQLGKSSSASVYASMGCRQNHKKFSRAQFFDSLLNNYSANGSNITHILAIGMGYKDNPYASDEQIDQADCDFPAYYMQNDEYVLANFKFNPELIKHPQNVASKYVNDAYDDSSASASSGGSDTEEFSEESDREKMMKPSIPLQDNETDSEDNDFFQNTTANSTSEESENEEPVTLQYRYKAILKIESEVLPKIQNTDFAQYIIHSKFKVYNQSLHTLVYVKEKDLHVKNIVVADGLGIRLNPESTTALYNDFAQTINAEEGYATHCHSGWGRTGQSIATNIGLYTHRVEKIFANNIIKENSEGIREFITELRNKEKGRPGLILQVDQLYCTLESWDTIICMNPELVIKGVEPQINPDNNNTILSIKESVAKLSLFSPKTLSNKDSFEVQRNTP